MAATRMSGTAIDGLRWLNPAGLGAMLLAAIAVQAKEPFDLKRSVSQAWARSRRTYSFMGLSATVSGLAISLSMTGWLIPYYHLAWLMYVMVWLAYAALLVAAWVPIREKPGEHSLWHPHFVAGGIVASAAAVSFGCILLVEPAVPPLSYGLTLIALPLTAVWPLYLSERLRRCFLASECVLVLLFALVVTTLTLKV